MIREMSKSAEQPVCSPQFCPPLESLNCLWLTSILSLINSEQYQCAPIANLFGRCSSSIRARVEIMRCSDPQSLQWTPRSGNTVRSEEISLESVSKNPLEKFIGSICR